MLLFASLMLLFKYFYIVVSSSFALMFALVSLLLKFSCVVM